MKTNRLIRIISLALCLTMVMALVPMSVGLADQISGSSVTAYDGPGGNSTGDKVFVSGNYMLENGGYWVPNKVIQEDGSYVNMGDQVFVRAGDVKNNSIGLGPGQASSKPAPTYPGDASNASSAPTHPSEASSAPTAPGTVTYPPGVTPSPTAPPVAGEIDPNYTGTIIRFTAPAQGLALFSDITFSRQAETVKSGTTITLTMDAGVTSHYTTYYNSKTYYVPPNLITGAAAGATLPPNQTGSAEFDLGPGLSTSLQDRIDELRAAINKLPVGNALRTRLEAEEALLIAEKATPPSKIPYYQKYIAGSGTVPATVDRSTYVGDLTSTGRINLRFVVNGIYSFTDGTGTYYISSVYVNDASRSSAQVVGNADAALMRTLTLASGSTLKLYISPKNTANYSVITGPQTLYAARDDSGWYRVNFNNQPYYIDPADATPLMTAGSGVAYNESVATSSFYVTIGASGADLYAKYSTNNQPLKNSSNVVIPPVGSLPGGSTVLVSSINGYWYAYADGASGSYKYFLKNGASSSMVNADNLTSYRIKIYLSAADVAAGAINSLPLYERKEASINAASKRITFAAKEKQTDTLGNDFIYITVKSVDETWFSIVLSDKTYYIKKSEIPAPPAGAQEEIERIATTASGKIYTVIIGVDNAPVYVDAACTTEGPLTYRKGTSVRAKKVNSTLYLVTIQATANSQGVSYYLPASYVAFVDGTDDASAVDPEDPSNKAKNEILQGEKDENFKDNIIAYVVPASGLWLYHDPACTRPAVALSAGRTVQLVQGATALPAKTYTTWYGSVQYYVNLSAMEVADNDLAANTTYSVQVNTAADVPLYKKATVTTSGASRTVTLSEPANVNLGMGTRANVKVHAYVWNAVTRSYTTTPEVYSTQYQNATYYFYASGNVVSGSTLTATTADNTNTSLIRKFAFTGNIWLFSSPDTSSGYIQVPSGTVVHGTAYNKDFYQVMHDGSVWYLLVSDSGLYTQEYLSITDGAPSSTFSVVIGLNGATSYNTMSTAKKLKATDATDTNLHAGVMNDLPAGRHIMATKVNASWYSSVDAAGTYYFQTSANTVSNSTSTSSVSSYVITLSGAVDLYTNISTYGDKLVTGLPVGTYTFRTVNETWSSVFYNGNTYYVKNAQILGDRIANGVPIASTTVGKTYTITIGTAADVFPDVALQGTRRGPIAAGTTLQGTKMYYEGTAGPPAISPALVYQVKFNGVTGYIDANNVIGVLSGDEADEAKKAAEEAEKNNTVYQSLSSGTKIYSSKDTNSTPAIIPSTSTFKLTRVDDNWYSLEFLGKTYYIPASEVKGGSSGGIGSSTPVGDSIMHTMSFAVSTYDRPSSDATVVGQIYANQLVKLKKVSDSWFELNQGSSPVYVKVSDIDGMTGSGTSLNQTTDGVGIITPTIKITGTSGTVNMRKQAKLGSTVMHRIPIGTVVPNNGYEKDSSGQLWYKTSYGGISGYVIGTYVEAVGTVSGTGGTSGTDPSLDIGRTLTVAVSSVNIRSGAGPTFGVIGKLDRGTAIVPTAYKEGTDGMIWYAFKYNANTTAYVRYDYLSGSIAATAELSGNVAIKAGDTNLRKGAGAGFSPVAKLARDTIVTIVGSGTDNNNVLWYRVTINNLSGYVRSDLVRSLTLTEVNNLNNAIIGSYKELKSGSTGADVLALQRQLIAIGYLAAGLADGNYGSKTAEAVMAFQKAKGLSATGVATPATQVAIFNTSVVSSGTTTTLNWFAGGGESLLKQYPNIQVYDINAKVTWNAKYINGANHADVVPASAGDAQKLKANNITGSYVRRPVIVTINGTKYAGSMYAVGHGSTNYVSYFSGVMCIHFTGSKTHGSGNVDADHQNAIDQALKSGY